MLYFILPTAVAVVDVLYWTIFRQRDMRIPPKSWQNLAFAVVGGLAGSYVVSRFGASEDLLASTLGAFVGGRVLNALSVMLNPQPLPPNQQFNQLSK
jgi:outer membrane lipoprotein SlyB